MKRFRNYAALAALTLLTTLAFAGNALAAQAPIGLGTATSFGVLSATGASTGGAGTVINGDLGSAGAITGPFTVNGVNYGAGGLTPGGRADLSTAYTDAANATSTAAVPVFAVATTLGPGVYTSGSSIDVNGSVTLTGGPDDVFIFQAVSSLTVNPGASITMAGGAQACNVFWQVGSNATLNNAGSTFVGTILAANWIHVTGAALTIEGRLLARDADISFVNSVVNRPSCGVAGSPGAPQGPDRQIYCDAAGRSYDLVPGQETQPPYAGLGLIPGYVDPVTGSKSCNFPLVVAPAPTTPTPTPTPLPAPTPTPNTKATKAAAAAKKVAAAKAAAAKAVLAAQRIAAKKKASSTTQITQARRARRRSGFTG